MYCVHENRFPSWLPSFIIILAFSFRFVRIPYHSIVPFGFSVRITIKHKAPRTPKHNETSDSAHNQIYCNAIFGFTFRSLSPTLNSALAIQWILYDRCVCVYALWCYSNGIKNSQYLSIFYGIILSFETVVSSFIPLILWFRIYFIWFACEC